MVPTTFDYRLILAGLVVGLFGWVLYWAGLSVIGGVIGAAAGGALGLFVSEFVQAPWAFWVFGGVGLALGLVMGIFLMRAIQMYFFFAAGATMGGTLTWRLLHQPQFAQYANAAPGWGLLVAVAVGAVLGGLVLIYFRRFIIALITSAIGTFLLVAGLPEQYRLVGGLVGLVVFLAAQIGLVHHYIERDSFDRRMKRWREPRPDVGAADDE